MKSCSVMVVNQIECDKDEIIKNKDIIINNAEIESLKKENEIFKKQIETYETMLKSMTSPQTINYFNYIVQNYPNAPALKEQESYTNLLESSTMTLIDVICMYYN